jgi:hypothetical protein
VFFVPSFFRCLQRRHASRGSTAILQLEGGGPEPDALRDDAAQPVGARLSPLNYHAQLQTWLEAKITNPCIWRRRCNIAEDYDGMSIYENKFRKYMGGGIGYCSDNLD